MAATAGAPGAKSDGPQRAAQGRGLGEYAEVLVGDECPHQPLGGLARLQHRALAAHEGERRERVRPRSPVLEGGV